MMNPKRATKPYSAATYNDIITPKLPDTDHPRIVIIGGGFGGLHLIKALKNTDVQIVLIDRHNYHTFQPLLYQVATGGLEPDSIAHSYRRIFKKYRNFLFRIAEVKEIITDNKILKTTIGDIEYDILVIATGSRTNYFNLEKVSNRLMPMKTVPQALNLRSLIIQNFEKALIERDPVRKESLMTIVIVGAGPTGVELAGALGEMRKHVLPKEYPELDLSQMKIIVYEMEERVIPPMSQKASSNAARYLRNLGVTLHLNTAVSDYHHNMVVLNNDETIPSDTLIWTAGVSGAIVNGLPSDVENHGRLKVDVYNHITALDHVYAIGDVAIMETSEYPKGHPMVAQVAIQQGRNLGVNLKRSLKNKQVEWKPFEYHDKGSLATIGRNKAVADLPWGKLKGFPAWILWLAVHIAALVGFRNKIIVFIDWVWNYFTYDRGMRLIIRPFKKNKLT